MVVAAPLRIVYFGTPAFAVPTLTTLLQSRHQVLAVISQPDRPKGRGHHVAATPTKEVALLTGIPVLQPAKVRDDAFLSDIARLKPDLGVVAAYGRNQPDALQRIPRRGKINVHGSLLPRYRGAAPVHRAVIAGDTITGVTIMRLVTELDAGPMLGSVTVPIAAHDTSVEVERNLSIAGARLLLDVVDRLAEGPIPEVAQDDAAATFAPKLLKSEGPIDWSLPAAVIHNRVRGLQPWPMASATVHGMRVLIHRTSAEDARTEAGPGVVVEAHGDVFAVAAGDGRILRILEIQPEGRRVMQAREFLNGRKLSPGTVLGAG
jgi:methionyl-tRNA formyltransferase